MCRVVSTRQKENEPLAAHHKRFVKVVRIAEVRWCALVPIKLAKKDPKCSMTSTKEDASKMAWNKFLAHALIKGALGIQRN